jgi:3-deoxy-D-manno-octulosonic-acid transferase
MIRFVYNLLFPLGLLLFLPAYLRKMFRRGNYRRNFGQRLGIYDHQIRARLSDRQVTWMHAVSVGEASVALRLAACLKEVDPGFFCALTVTTTTGLAFARKQCPDWIEVLYSPLDFWPVMHRFFSVVRPEKIVLVEAEVWPNMMAEARIHGVPVALVNARLSARSERRFRRFRFVVAPVFRQLDLVCVPEEDDVSRWTDLGVSSKRIYRTGSIKYDTRQIGSDAGEPRRVLDSFGIAVDQPILFGGSTHPGEEAILAEVFLKLRSEFPSLLLIIVPRHVERTREIRTMLETLSLHVSLRSEGGTKRPMDCLLIDTTGELRDWYSVATVVFIGKSLTAHGGQNPVEAIVAGKPVIFGPNMENFEVLARSLVEHRGAMQVENAQALQDASTRLIRDPEVREELVSTATNVLGGHRGATLATATMVSRLTFRGAAD